MPESLVANSYSFPSVPRTKTKKSSRDFHALMDELRRQTQFLVTSMRQRKVYHRTKRAPWKG